MAPPKRSQSAERLGSAPVAKESDALRRGRLLTRKQVMKRLLADFDFRRRTVTCVLPAVRHRSGWRFYERDLEEWIEQQRDSRTF
jgi:hypothetical protein